MKQLTPLFVFCFSALVVLADGNKTIWQPGNTYHTHISYKISIENAELEPGTNKCYYGRYSAPKLMFWPVIEFTTSGIIKKGRDYYAQRQYLPAYQTVSGLEGLKWKSDNWMINPRRWWRAVCRYRDEDFNPLKEGIKHYNDAQRAAERAAKEVEAAEKGMEAVRKKLSAETADAKKELGKLFALVDSYEAGSEKRAKAEAKLAKVATAREKKEREIRGQLVEAAKRLKSAREAVADVVRHGLPCESFYVFYDTEHNAAPFAPETQHLFLKWNDDSIGSYFRGKHKNALELRVGSVEMSVEDALSKGNGWNVLPKPISPSVTETLSSEFGVTASTIFDDPTGKLRLVQDRDSWDIDASAINGLLATDELRSLIHFKGTLEVARYCVRPTDCANVGLDPFEGWKVKVVSSHDAEMGYDTGDGYQPFRITFSNEGRNTIEFWFDANNEVLRYAKVIIEKENYEGNIPNPNLGKTLSQIKGTARGNVRFECEYTTSINQKLRNLDDDKEGDELK